MHLRTNFNAFLINYLLPSNNVALKYSTKMLIEISVLMEPILNKKQYNNQNVKLQCVK